MDKEIISHLLDIKGSVAELQTDMKAIKEDFRVHLERDEDIHTTQAAALQSLEDSRKKWKWMVAGGTGVVIMAREVFAAIFGH